jgi:hypothetical protein
MAETETIQWREIHGLPEDDGTRKLVNGKPRLHNVYNSLQWLVGSGTDDEKNPNVLRVVRYQAKNISSGDEEIIVDEESVVIVRNNFEKFKVLEHPIGYGARRVVEASIQVSLPQEVGTTD